MSEEFKKEYISFTRVIMAEFMSEDELKALDQKYSEAKLKRLEERLRKQMQG